MFAYLLVSFFGYPALKHEVWRKIVSGKTSHLAAPLLRLLLTDLSYCYLGAVKLRNFLYSKGCLKSHAADAVVMSIGNITAGGTGKTPLVIWLCNLLGEKKIATAILTRGYKSKKGIFYDEPAILVKSCPNVKVVVNPDRVAGAAEAVSKFATQVLVMDDGFQHRRLRRDLDIIAIDATCPFGYGKLLPAGLLRESLCALKRADAVIITRSDQVGEGELVRIEHELLNINAKLTIAKSIHAPICAKSVGRQKLTLEELEGKRVFAFCGIGNPQAFLSTIEKLGMQLLGSKFYNDHYHYTEDDMADIYEEAKYLGAELILTTHKDWTKTALQGQIQKDIPFAYLPIEIKFTAGDDKLRALIEDALQGRIAKKQKGQAQENLKCTKSC